MSFDYIIVGAGSAGCVLADQLTADGRHKVLLIEEGGEGRSLFVAMPKGFARVSATPSMMSFIPTTPHGDIPPEVWIRGKMLGGSSAVNGMMYFRGHPQDYDDWAEAGATGWGWNNMKGAFEKTEDRLLPAATRKRSDLGERVIAAAERMGIPRVENLNSENQFGVAYAPRTIRNGFRNSAAKVFLKPARKRPNLHVETGVKIERVIFHERRAIGVVGRRAGREVRFKASREVILSAGALASPQILQRSGIGPANQLRALGINPLCDSPGVGSNLLEHRLLMMHYRLSIPIGANADLRGLGLVRSALRYVLSRSGVLADGAYDVGAFFKTHASLDRPDCELLMAPFGFTVDAKGKVGVPGYDSFHMFGYPLRSRSQGSILIGGLDPAVPATIRPNYLADPYDMTVTVAMFRFLRRLASMPPLSDVIAEELSPGKTIDSDEEIITAFRTRGQPGLHACGTVAMGDQSAPLDPALRVRGVQGLRVVDASVMPTMVSANTNGPVMAVGWRAGELILQDAN